MLKKNYKQPMASGMSLPAWEIIAASGEGFNNKDLAPVFPYDDILMGENDDEF